MANARISKVLFKEGRAPHTGSIVKHYVPFRGGKGYVFDSYWKLTGPGEYTRLSALEYVRSIR
jgi:hypothetical protein